MTKATVKTVALGVTGGIAGYKAVDVASRLTKAGIRVEVIMTEAAQKFVAPLTFSTLTGIPVHTEMFGPQYGDKAEVEHIAIGDRADLIAVVPASADVIAKAAHGIADDFLTTVLLAADSPVIWFPAMNTRMWRHPATQNNVNILRDMGQRVVLPDSGYLACGTEGEGRLASVDAIVEHILGILDDDSAKQDLVGKKVLISAGPTEEPIDPVRAITNHSSGKMGYAIARAAELRGATVTLVSGPVHINPPEGVKVIPVKTAAEMQKSLEEVYPEADITIMAAAVSDYRVKNVSETKRKKDGSTYNLELVENPDILKGLGQNKHGFLVGFAAETDNLRENALAKLKKKNTDMIVANDVSDSGIGFGSDDNKVTLYHRDGTVDEIPKMSKEALAGLLLDKIIEKL